MSPTSYRAAPPRVKMRSARIRAEIGTFHKNVMQQRQKSKVMGVAGARNNSFGDGLAAAARSIISDGRQALADPELSDPEAVHEVRKALKAMASPLGGALAIAGRQAGQQYSTDNHLLAARY